MKEEMLKKIIEEYRKGNVKFNMSLDTKGKMTKCSAFSFPLLLSNDFKKLGFAVTRNGYEMKGKEFLKLIKDNKELLTKEELKSFEYPIKAMQKER